MIIHFSAGTAQIRQSGYFGVTNGFYFPAGEGGVTVAIPSRTFTAREKPVRFIAQKKVVRFTARLY